MAISMSGTKNMFLNYSTARIVTVDRQLLLKGQPDMILNRPFAPKYELVVPSNLFLGSALF